MMIQITETEYDALKEGFDENWNRIKSFHDPIVIEKEEREELMQVKREHEKMKNFLIFQVKMLNTKISHYKNMIANACLSDVVEFWQSSLDLATTELSKVEELLK